MLPPAYKLIFMTKQSDSGSRDTASLATTPAPPARLASKHLLGIEGLNPLEINALIDRGDMFADLIQAERPIAPPLSEVLKGRTVLNLFFENSTRTRVSFELAAKNLGGSVLNINVAGSSVKKGETLLDMATTLNAMHPHILVVRHNCSGAAQLLSQHVDAAVINAGDGRHEHPTQALLDALTIKRRVGRIEGLKIAICGDIATDGDLQPLDPTNAAFDGQRVEKRLGRMLVPAVSGIDYCGIDMLAQKLRGARTIVPDNQNMRVHRVQRCRHVEQRLALFHRGPGNIDVQHRPAEVLGRQFEGHAGAGGVFKKQVENGAPLEHFRQGRRNGSLCLNEVGEHIAAIDQGIDLEGIEPFDAKKMLRCQPGRRGWRRGQAGGVSGPAVTLLCHENQLIGWWQHCSPAEITPFRRPRPWRPACPVLIAGSRLRRARLGVQPAWRVSCRRRALPIRPPEWTAVRPERRWEDHASEAAHRQNHVWHHIVVLRCHPY